MKKYTVLLTIVGLVITGMASGAIGESAYFKVSAELPKAKGVSITATEVNGSSGKFGDEVDAMDFDPLDYNSTYGIWTADHYFAVDVGSTDGAGSPDVLVSYGSESSPSGQDKGLGYKATAAFSLVSGGPDPDDQTESDLTSHGPVKLLAQLSGGEPIDETDLDGGFLRIRVGLYDGADDDLNDDGGEPFTNSDVPGDYSGVLTVTATVD